MAVMAVVVRMARLCITGESRGADELLRMRVRAHESELVRLEWDGRNGRSCILMNLVSLRKEIFECHSGYW